MHSFGGTWLPDVTNLCRSLMLRGNRRCLSWQQCKLPEPLSLVAMRVRHIKASMWHSKVTGCVEFSSLLWRVVSVDNHVGIDHVHVRPLLKDYQMSDLYHSSFSLLPGSIAIGNLITIG